MMKPETGHRIRLQRRMEILEGIGWCDSPSEDEWKHFLETLYGVGYSIGKIAQFVGCSEQAILMDLRRYNIHRRSKGGANFKKHVVFFRGKLASIREVAGELGWCYSSVYSRVLTGKPIDKVGQQTKLFAVWKGERYPLRDLSIKTGVPYGTMRNWLIGGHKVEPLIKNHRSYRG